MKTINVHEAKTHLSALLATIETKGESFLICRAGRPIAELRALPASRGRLAVHPLASGITFAEDPTVPLAAEEWGNLQ